MSQTASSIVNNVMIKGLYLDKYAKTEEKKNF